MDIISKIIEEQKRPTPFGVMEIGHFTLHKDVHKALEIGYTIKDLCEMASMLSNRVDNKFYPTDKTINPKTISRYYNLKSVPSSFAFITITKNVAKGDLRNDEIDELTKILMKNNSFGDTIIKDLRKFMRKREGVYLGRKVKVHGMSDWFAVCYVAICIVELNKYGMLDEALNIEETLKKFKEAGSVKDVLEGQFDPIGIAING